MDFKQKLLDNPNNLQNLDVDFEVEIASKKIPLAEALSFQEGGAFIFDDSIETPLNIIVNGERIAEGILVKTEDNYGIKITKILSE